MKLEIFNSKRKTLNFIDRYYRKLIKENPETFFPGPRTYLRDLKEKSYRLDLNSIISLKRELAKLDRNFKMGRADFWNSSEEILIKLCNPQFSSGKLS